MQTKTLLCIQQEPGEIKNVYVKSTAPGMYCWVNGSGEWVKEWDTTMPDLQTYGLAE